MTRQTVFEVAENIPEAKRKSALSLMVRKWSPFAATAYSAHWVGARATVYAWDDDKIAAGIRSAGYDPAKCVVWPETFIRPRATDAVRLCAMTDGFEGQVWRDGFLAATRWWPDLPAHRDWTTFLRASGVELTPETLVAPTAIQDNILEFPWTVVNTPVTDLWSLVQNERAAAIAAAAVAVPLLFFLSQAAVLAIGIVRAESAMASMSAANQSIRKDRSTSLSNLDAIDSYLSLEDFPPQFELMAAATELLRDKMVSISEWNFDSGVLELAVQADRELEAPVFIEAFEQDPRFSNVSANVGSQQKELRLRMQVDPQAWPTS